MSLIDNLVAHYKFDENTGTNVNDSQNRFDGTFNGSGSKWTTGKINTAGVFNGSDDYVSCGSVSLGIGTSMTIALWVNMTTLTAANYYCWLSFGGYVSGGFIFQRAGDSGDKLRFAWNGSDYYDGAAFSTTGSDCLIGVTILSGVPQKFYINNVPTTATRGSGSGTFSCTDPKTLEMGRRGDATQYIAGEIDELAIWNTNLGDSGMDKLYNNGLGITYPYKDKLPGNYQKYIKVGEGMGRSEGAR